MWATTRNRALVDEWVIGELLGTSVMRSSPTNGPPPDPPCAGPSGPTADVRWRMLDATTAHEEGRLDGRDFYVTTALSRKTTYRQPPSPWNWVRLDTTLPMSAGIHH